MTANSPGEGLRICHLGKFYPPAPGGMESHVQTLARAQARLGADVQVMCINHQNDAGSDVTWRAGASTPTLRSEDLGVRVVRLGRRASLSKFDLSPSLPGAFWHLYRERIDILHVHAPNPTMLAAVSVLPQYATLIVTHHSDVIKQRVLAAAFSPIERMVYARAKAVFSTSDQYVAGSATLLRVAGKVRTLPLGIDLDPFLSPSLRALDYARGLRANSPNTPLWLAVGRLVYYKGFRTAIEALARVPGRLLIVGRGPLESDLKEHARKFGVSERIEWVSYMDDAQLVGAYAAADALWFSSNARSEAFGLTQVEAMASGCPVINTAIPNSGVAWVSQDERTGLTVPVSNPGALANAAKRILNENGLRTRLSRAAVDRATREFDDAVMAQRSIDYYLEASEASRLGAQRRQLDAAP